MSKSKHNGVDPEVRVYFHLFFNRKTINIVAVLCAFFLLFILITPWKSCALGTKFGEAYSTEQLSHSLKSILFFNSILKNIFAVTSCEYVAVVVLVAGCSEGVWCGCYTTLYLISCLTSIWQKMVQWWSGKSFHWTLLIMFLFCKLNLSHFHLSAILKLVLTGRPLV